MATADPSDDYVDPGDPLWWVPWWYRAGIMGAALLAVVVAHV